MGTRNKHGLIWLAVVLTVFALGLNGCKKDNGEAPNTTPPGEGATETSQQEAGADPLETAASLFSEPPMSVQNIVNSAKTWQPAFKEWWGKIAPDFTLTDIDGKVHKLSDYRGKDVIVVIWTTLIGTCKLEVPHLKELRTGLEEKDLAILTISSESVEVLKDFASQQALTFTVLSGTGLPAPYGAVQYAPSSFFIDRQGRFKLAATGLMPAEDAKAIVQAQ